MISQTALNSLPSTNVGNAIKRSPNTRRGIVIICPKNDRGVISPYPTVVIAVEKRDDLHEVKNPGRNSLTRTNQAAAGMDFFT